MRKNMRKICSILLAAGMLLPTGAERAVQAAETASDVELKDGQRIASIRVLSIVGNELTYYEETTEETTEEATEQSAEEATEKSSEEVTEKSAEEAEETSEETAEKPSEAPTEEASEEPAEKTTEEASEKSSEQQSEQPAEASTEQLPEKSSEESSEQSAEASTEQSSKQPPERPTEGMPEGFSPDNMKNFNPGKMQEEGTTTYLPVAVTVHTDTGEKMTFSILEEGDELEVLMEETESGEMILEIWMKSTEGDSDE